MDRYPCWRTLILGAVFLQGKVTVQLFLAAARVENTGTLAGGSVDDINERMSLLLICHMRLREFPSRHPLSISDQSFPYDAVDSTITSNINEGMYRLTVWMLRNG
jgi:hypothetical protein